MQFVVQEVQACAQLEVPALLGLIGDGVGDSLIVGIGMRDVNDTVADGLSLYVGLHDVAEEVDVIASVHVALAGSSIDVAALVAQLVGDAKLRQQLAGGVGQMVLYHGARRAGRCSASRTSRDRGAGRRAIVYLVLAIVVAQSQSQRQTVGQREVRLMVGSQVGDRQLEEAGHRVDGGLHVQSGSIDGSLGSTLCGSLGSSLWHALCKEVLQHAGLHAVEHALTHGVEYALCHGSCHTFTKGDVSRGAHSLACTVETRGMLPDAAARRAQHEFFGQCVHLLMLTHDDLVHRQIVDVLHQSVVEMLEAGGRGEHEAVELVADGES